MPSEGPLAFENPLKYFHLEIPVEAYHCQRLGTVLRHRGAKAYILWGQLDFLQEVLDPSCRDVESTVLNRLNWVFLVVSVTMWRLTDISNKDMRSWNSSEGAALNIKHLIQLGGLLEPHGMPAPVVGAPAPTPAGIWGTAPLRTFPIYAIASMGPARGMPG